MDRNEFIEYADLLTDKQAEAFYRRHVEKIPRQTVAEQMETSASNVDNLERAARSKIMRASNLMAIINGIDYNVRQIGTCAECDEPAEELRPDPRGDNRPIEEMRMLCPDCAASVPMPGDEVLVRGPDGGEEPGVVIEYAEKPAEEYTINTDHLTGAITLYEYWEEERNVHTDPVDPGEDVVRVRLLSATGEEQGVQSVPASRLTPAPDPDPDPAPQESE